MVEWETKYMTDKIRKWLKHIPYPKWGEWSIYTLSLNGSVFYVGCTQNSVTQRFLAHLYVAKRNNRHSLYRKIRWILLNNRLPEVEILDTIISTKEDALNTEQYWISQMEAWGFKLLNKHKNYNYGKKLYCTGV